MSNFFNKLFISSKERAAKEPQAITDAFREIELYVNNSPALASGPQLMLFYYLLPIWSTERASWTVSPQNLAGQISIPYNTSLGIFSVGMTMTSPPLVVGAGGKVCGTSGGYTAQYVLTFTTAPSTAVGAGDIFVTDQTNSQTMLVNIFNINVVSGTSQAIPGTGAFVSVGHQTGADLTITASPTNLLISSTAGGTFTVYTYGQVTLT